MAKVLKYSSSRRHSVGTVDAADITATGVAAGSYTSANVTVNAAGQITVAANGSGGGVASFNTRTGTVTLSSADVTTALGYGVARPLFDHYADAGNTSTAETDLYSDTLAAGRLATNGEKIDAEYGGIFVSSATATRQIRISFAGETLFDTGSLTLSLSSAWTCYVTIIRVSSSTIRYMISFTTEGAALAAYTAVGEQAGLTLSGTAVLKITGQASGVGAATNDVVAKVGSVTWRPAA